MDWGLFEMKSGDNKFLREETVYSSNVSGCVDASENIVKIGCFAFSIFITSAWWKT